MLKINFGNICFVKICSRTIVAKCRRYGGDKIFKKCHDSQKIYRFKPYFPETEDKEVNTNSRHKMKNKEYLYKNIAIA